VTARLRVRLTPRAGTDRVDGVVDGVLRARVTAAPVDGGANEALCRLLARELGVPRTGVRVVSGATARVKVVEVGGVGDEEVRIRWPGLA
jgi:uncharacterized protein YggU (UPF0235/DUF167 family)